MALYDGINFRPPQAVAREAILGLEYRERAGGRGGLTSRQAAAEGVGSGVQRAASLRYRQNQSPETIRRMVAFFSRHERNKEVKPEYRETPWKDAGKVAWLLWGGDAGRDWQRRSSARWSRVKLRRKPGSSDGERPGPGPPVVRTIEANYSTVKSSR